MTVSRVVWLTTSVSMTPRLASARISGWPTSTPACGRDDADAGVAVGVHEPQRDDPVEPGVGDLVRDGRSTLVATARGGDRLLQGGDGLRLLDSLRGRRRQHRGDARGDLADERGARPRRERLQRCGFHQREIRFPSLRVDRAHYAGRRGTCRRPRSRERREGPGRRWS